MKRFRLGAASVLMLSVLFWPDTTFAEAASKLADRQLDCVIEPRVTVKLGAAIGGLLADVTVDRGDFVKAGQIVAHLESRVDESNVALARVKASNDSQVLSNQARTEFLRRKFGRQESLLQSNNVARSTFDEAETDAKMSEFSTKEAQLNLEAGKLELTHQEELLKQREIRSPINGVVQERALFAGQYTNDTNHIMTIAQIDPLNVEVFVPIAFYGQVGVGGVAEIMPEDPIGGSYSATVTIVDRVVDASSGTFGVRLEMPNPQYKLPAGVRCQVRFGRINSNPDSNSESANPSKSGESKTLSPSSLSQEKPPALFKSSEATDVGDSKNAPASAASPPLFRPVLSLPNMLIDLKRPEDGKPQIEGRQPTAIDDVSPMGFIEPRQLHARDTNRG